MPVYAIGDVQGCYDELLQLLERIDFHPATDQLWFTGDLVNRGPKSLEVLRFVKALGSAATTVLGNHDLHLLASAYDWRKLDRRDTLQTVLGAPDRDELLEWLRMRPLLHSDSTLGYTLIHAGLPPQWDVDTARRLASEVEGVLQGGSSADFFQNMYGDEPALWSEDLAGWDRLRFITNCLTRLRYCAPDGMLALRQKGPPGSQPAPLKPWFEVPNRASQGSRIVFGHWSTLGYEQTEDILALDTGCLWGGRLTARQLDGGLKCIQVLCPGAMRPIPSYR